MDFFRDNGLVPNAVYIGCVMSGLSPLSGIRGRASRAGCQDSKDGSSRSRVIIVLV